MYEPVYVCTEKMHWPDYMQSALKIMRVFLNMTCIHPAVLTAMEQLK
jgi:hypothetical protein